MPITFTIAKNMNEDLQRAIIVLAMHNLIQSYFYSIKFKNPSEVLIIIDSV